ncbi:MAG: spore coat protein CotJB [bacterium]
MLFENDFNFLSFMGLSEEKESTNELYDSTTGFVKGNMFEKEYSKYKEYRPKMPRTTCEKNAKLYRIMELNFAINDLNLWLDIHPDDEKVFNILKEYIHKLIKCEEDYVKNYGPLEVCENVFDKNLWLGNNAWEKEDSKYV